MPMPNLGWDVNKSERLLLAISSKVTISKVQSNVVKQISEFQC